MNRPFLLILLGMVALWSHTIDEVAAFGQPSGPPLGAQLAITALVLAFAAVQARLGRWRVVPAALVGLLGLFATGMGWAAHVQPLLWRGPGPADYTGVIFMLGGLLLVTGAALILRQAATSTSTAGI